MWVLISDYRLPVSQTHCVAVIFVRKKMGDERRGPVFALFIKKNFKADNILVVADGKGQVSRSLANKGFDCTVIEAKPRFEGRDHKHIVYKRGVFDGDLYNSGAKAYDVIVGMHPDEATGEILRYAGRAKIPFAIVPCCIKGRDSAGINNYTGWLKRLKSIVISTHYVFEAQLKMNGKNICLYGRPK